MDDVDRPLTDIEAEYRDGGMAELSDVELVRSVAAVVATPRRDPADSFVLHAPLELAARSALLPWVAADDRHLARLHILAIATQYRNFGPPIEAETETATAQKPARGPGPDADTVAGIAAPGTGTDTGTSTSTDADPFRWLGDALAAGDLDGVDRAAKAIAAVTTPDGLSAALTDPLLPLTGAAAHAPIFLHQFGRVGRRGELPADLLRPLARDLARHPDWRLRWIDEWRPTGPTDPRLLEEAMADGPTLGTPGSSFIHPLYMQVDDGGVAAAHLGSALGHYSPEAARTLLRVAARAMLVDTAEHVPYGWTHSLTIPQAVLGLAPRSADPDRALAIAATGLLAFRAGLGSGPLPAVELTDLPPVDPGSLATDAATRHDAHIVKYTLACLDAAADDPAFARLHLSAADRLLRWWDAAGGDPTDPLA